MRILHLEHSNKEDSDKSESKLPSIWSNIQVEENVHLLS